MTGRSRLALFASRVPAALALCWAVVSAAYALMLIGTFAFAVQPAHPERRAGAQRLGFVLLATGVLCVVAVGFSSLVDSKPGSIIALIAWQLVASPLIVSICSLGSGARGRARPGDRALQPAGEGHARNCNRDSRRAPPS